VREARKERKVNQEMLAILETKISHGKDNSEFDYPPQGMLFFLFEL